MSGDEPESTLPPAPAAPAAPDEKSPAAVDERAVDPGAGAAEISRDVTEISHNVAGNSDDEGSVSDEEGDDSDDEGDRQSSLFETSADVGEVREGDPYPSMDEAEALGAGHEGEAAPAIARDPLEADEPPASSRLPSILESLLFASDRPMNGHELAKIVGEPSVAVVEQALVALAIAWADRGVQLHPVAGGYQFRTASRNATWVQRLVAQKPVKISRPQLETLAIVSYRQPITRPEIDDIRGVDSGAALKSLLDRSLLRILGKKEEPGRPLLYGTTREFLEFFNLGDLRQLPTLREFHELSDEHRAQVEALERAAPPGTVEPAPAAPVAPLLRVDLSDAPLDDDLGEIDALINEADGRAHAAADALGVGDAGKGSGHADKNEADANDPANAPTGFDETVD